MYLCPQCPAAARLRRVREERDGDPRMTRPTGLGGRRRRDDLQELAQRHLWMHFTRMGAYARRRGADHRPRRGLLRLRRPRPALPRRAVGAVLRQRRPRPRRARPRPRPTQMRELGFYTNWSYAHPRAIELAARIAALAPGDLNRVFFTSGGSEAVESALKLARAYHRHAANAHADQADRARARLPRHLARRARGDRPDRRCATPFEPLDARRLSRAQHEPVPLAGGPRPAVGGRRDRGADPVRGSRDGRGRDPRAGPERRRLLHAAGRLLRSACARSATATACC